MEYTGITKTEPDNPHIAGYWIGRLITIPHVLENWDFDDGILWDLNEIQTTKWIKLIKDEPIFITSTNGQDNEPVEDAHFYWTFIDGKKMEAPCGIMTGYRGEIYPEQIFEEIERYDYWQANKAKPKTELQLSFLTEEAAKEFIAQYASGKTGLTLNGIKILER